ncbi:hypothetical protein BH10CYA1_BH10CYA1_64170 [soil metagenome]
MARAEDWQTTERNSLADGVVAMQLSRTSQDLFKRAVDFQVRYDLPQSLDFGTSAELYRSSVHSNEKPLASSLMTGSAELVAIGDDYLNRNDLNSRAADAPVPVEKLLADPNSDISMASQHSSALKNLIDQMRKHPWEVKSITEHPLQFQDYDPECNTIHIDSALTEEKQLETFGHELYHATHQNLDDLYGQRDKVSLEMHKQIKMEQESGAFLAEVKVNRELKNGQPVTFEFVKNGEVHKQKVADLLSYNQDGTINDARSKQAITQFLQTHRAPQYNKSGALERDEHGNIKTFFYPETHESGYYKNYAPNFDQNRDALLKKGWLGKGY